MTNPASIYLAVEGSSNIISANLKEKEKQGHDLGVECYNVSQLCAGLERKQSTPDRRDGEPTLTKCF